MAENDLVITAIVADHIPSSTSKPLVEVQHPNFTMVDMGTITWVVMGLGCLVLTLCVLLASILIYQHCRWTIEKKMLGWSKVYLEECTAQSNR